MKIAPLWLKCLLLVSASVVVTRSQGQTTSPVTPPNVFPVSPEVATLGKFVDTPVGSYTGIPDISVPLYEVKYKSISIPLTLSYHGGGVRVSDEASWVGLNWDIFSGGFITESRVGRKSIAPDENLTFMPGWDNLTQLFNSSSDYFPGYQYLIGQHEPHIGDGWGCSGAGTDEGAILTLMNTRGLGQPDIYTFSFPGHSGKFTTDPHTLEPIILQKSEEMKIERIYTGDGSWKVTTLDGKIYYFEKWGKGRDHNSTIITTNTWKLTKIVSKDGAEIIFDYAPYVSGSPYVNETYKSDISPLWPDNFLNGTSGYSSSEDFYLTKITTPDEVIEFTLEEREDLSLEDVTNPNITTRRLKEIIVKDAHSLKPKNSIEFSYGYFDTDLSKMGSRLSTINDNNRDVRCKRLKLLGVKEVGYDNLGTKTYYTGRGYSFEYEENVKLPPKNSFSCDYWGYYNGEINNTLIPDIAPLYLPQDAYRLTGDPVYNYENIPMNLLRSNYRANRSPNVEYMKAAMLKKINLPTGGAKVYTFEPNTFSNVTIFNSEQAKKVPVQFQAVDVNQLNNPQYPPKVNIGFPYRKMNIHLSITFSPGVQMLSFAQMLDSEVRLMKEVGSTVTTLQSWKMVNNIDEENKYNQQRGYFLETDYMLTPEEGATYYVEAILPDNLSTQMNDSQHTASVRCIVQYNNYPSGTGSEFYGGGLRIAQIQLLNEVGETVYRKSYRYTLDGLANGPTSGILLSPPKYLTFKHLVFRKLNVAPCEYAEWGAFTVTTKEQDLYEIANNSNISLSLSSTGGVVGYSTVTEIEESSTGNGLVNSRIKYEFKNQVNTYKEGFPEDPWLDNGQLIKKTYQTGDASPVTVKEESFTYESPEASNKIIKGYFLEDGYRGSEECPNRCPDPLYPLLYNPLVYPDVWTNQNRFTLRSYPIRSKFYQLKTKVVKDYSGNAVLTNTTTYTYNNLGLLASETAQTSKGDVRQTQYFYPDDSPSDFTFADMNAMKNDFYNPVILQKQFFNSVLQNKFEYEYSYHSAPRAMYLTTNIREKDGQSNLIKFVDIPAYSLTQGNPLQFSTNDGINTVVIWGLNATKPVAKVTGATISEIEAALGTTLTALESYAPSSLRTALLNLYSLSKAQVNLFLYNDKSQLIEMLDQNQASSYYDYDEFGRLKNAKDRDGNIVKAIDYWYMVK